MAGAGLYKWLSANGSSVGETGDWNFLFSMEGDFVADTNEDSLYCEAHSLEFG
jgi:hypothetical protein